jgi:hypothetical protein
MMIGAATVAKKPGAPGRGRISRKAIAQGRPVVRLSPVVLPRAFLLHAGHGCGQHPAFPAPSVSRAGLTQSSDAQCAARVRMRATVIATSRCDEAIQNLCL